MNKNKDESRCRCCGRVQSQLKQFNKEWLSEVNGKPVSEDVFFLKTYRRDAPYGDGVEVYEAYLDICKGNFEVTEQLLRNTYDKETAEQVIFWAIAYAQVGSSWECSDCYFLEGEDYDEKCWGETESKIPIKEPNWGNLRKVVPITETIKQKRLQEKSVTVEFSEEIWKRIHDTARSIVESKELYRQKYAANNHRANEKPS
jgi:hypothetical protein